MPEDQMHCAHTRALLTAVLWLLGSGCVRKHGIQGCAQHTSTSVCCCLLVLCVLCVGGAGCVRLEPVLLTGRHKRGSQPWQSVDAACAARRLLWVSQQGAACGPCLACVCWGWCVCVVGMSCRVRVADCRLTDCGVHMLSPRLVACRGLQHAALSLIRTGLPSARRPVQLSHAGCCCTGTRACGGCRC